MLQLPALAGCPPAMLSACAAQKNSSRHLSCLPRQPLFALRLQCCKGGQRSSSQLASCSLGSVKHCLLQQKEAALPAGRAC